MIIAIDRRNFVKSGVLVAVGSTVLGGVMTAAEAYANKAPLKVLTESESFTLAKLGETLVTGAEQAGIAHFVDYQLSVDPDDCLLIAKYFQVKPPYLDIYRAGLKALNDVCIRQFEKPFHALTENQIHPLIESLFDGSVKEWQGPPAPLFYLLVRNDAVDVVYGTPEGFEKLSVPYMAHIMPPGGWS